MSEDNQTGLPASVEAAWGLRGRPTKGPKPGLSLERIVEAAIRLADAEGLGAVSMSRVAAELGAATMSLYRYVASKDELLTLMVDAAAGQMTPPAPDEDWRTGLTRWAWGYRAAALCHPWSVRVPISGPPVTPNQVAWMEDALRSLRDTGLTEAEKMSVLLLVSGYVRNEALLTSDIVAAARASGHDPAQIMPGYGRLLLRLTNPERFPALHRVIASGALDIDDDPDDEFIFGLDRILDGVEVLIRARTDSPRSAVTS